MFYVNYVTYVIVPKKSFFCFWLISSEGMFVTCVSCGRHGLLALHIISPNYFPPSLQDPSSHSLCAYLFPVVEEKVSNPTCPVGVFLCRASILFIIFKISVFGFILPIYFFFRMTMCARMDY